MRSNSILLGLAVLLSVPATCSADGIFFWSILPFGQGAQPGEEFFQRNDRGDSAPPFDYYLYYRAGAQDVSDGFTIDLSFESNLEVMEAEVFNFDVVLDAAPSVVLSSRWDEVGPITIDEGTVTGFSASNLSDSDGMLFRNNGTTGVFLDLGYDDSADAFIVGRVTLRGLGTSFEYLTTSASNAGEEISLEFQLNAIAPPSCLLDPPYGGSTQAFRLSLDDDYSAGFNHCVGNPFDSCDGTVWNRFEASADGLFTCDTFLSEALDTRLEIYLVDSVIRPTLIGFNDDVAGNMRSRISFPVEQGAEYFVRILGPTDQVRATGLRYELLEGALSGDVNVDGAVNLLDVASFVNLVTNSIYDPSADINFDGDVDLLDIAPFVELLVGR